MRGAFKMKRLTLVLAAMGMLAADFAGAAPADGGLEVTLSPGGGSLAKALAKVASLRAHNVESNITLTIAVNGCTVSRPLVIDRTLAGPGTGKFTLRGAPGMRPKIFGSVPVREWTKVKGKMNGRDDVWEADVSKFKLTEQLPALFANGSLLTMARYPNFNPKAPYAGGWAYVPGRWISMYKFPGGETRSEMKVGAKDWHDWKVPSEGRIVIFPRQRFGSSYVPIADLNREERKLVFAKDLCDFPRPGDTYILSGFREELDDPGEWCHDLKAEKVYVIPPAGCKDPNRLRIMVPLAAGILTLDGVENVTVENLEFCAAKGGVVAKGGHDITFRACSFHDIGGGSWSYALDLAWGQDRLVEACDFYDLGGGGIHITGGNVQHPTTVDNCWFHHIGKFTHCSNAIFMEGTGYRVTHNLFHDLPHWAVFHTGNHHTLTDNRVHHYMLETEDGAAFYTCNKNGNIGTVTARNWISHGVGFAKGAGWGPLGFFQNSHGLYFDSGPRDGFVYNNVIDHVSGMAFKMDGNCNQVVTNNVLYRTGNRGLLHWSYAMNLSGGEACSNRLERNIWYFPDCPSQLYVLVQGADISKQQIDYNWICPGKEAKVPNLRGARWEDDWIRKWGADRHSVVSKDISFTDPKNGDFTPKDRAMVKRLGLTPVVVTKSGLYVSKARPKLPVEPDGAANHPEWFQNPKDHVNPEKTKDEERAEKARAREK